MRTRLKKLLGVFVLFLLSLSAICVGIWGFFNVEILPALMGKHISRIFYCMMGLSSLYGVHLFILYTKQEFSKESPNDLNYEATDEASCKEQENG